MLEGLVFNTALLLSHQVILGTKLHFFGSQLLPLFIHPLIQFFFPLPIIYLLVTSSLTPWTCFWAPSIGENLCSALGYMQIDMSSVLTELSGSQWLVSAFLPILIFCILLLLKVLHGCLLTPSAKGETLLSQSFWINDSQILPQGIGFNIWKWLRVIWSQVWWKRPLRYRNEPSSMWPGSRVLWCCIISGGGHCEHSFWVPCGGLPRDAVLVKLPSRSSHGCQREGLPAAVGSLHQWGHCGGLLCHQLLSLCLCHT